MRSWGARWHGRTAPIESLELRCSIDASTWSRFEGATELFRVSVVDFARTCAKCNLHRYRLHLLRYVDVSVYICTRGSFLAQQVGIAKIWPDYWRRGEHERREETRSPVAFPIPRPIPLTASEFPGAKILQLSSGVPRCARGNARSIVVRDFINFAGATRWRLTDGARSRSPCYVNGRSRPVER